MRDDGQPVAARWSRQVEKRSGCGKFARRHCLFGARDTRLRSRRPVGVRCPDRFPPYGQVAHRVSVCIPSIRVSCPLVRSARRPPKRIMSLHPSVAKRRGETQRNRSRTRCDCKQTNSPTLADVQPLTAASSPGRLAPCHGIALQTNQSTSAK